MRKTFFIDSENVGDDWISLLDTVTEEDSILVFYTAKSPHMNYKNVIRLKESSKEVEFIECCEGNNALDFQLCTDLGFRVHDIADGKFVIVTNDTGYDAVVKYWQQRNIPVSRMKSTQCASKPKKETKVSSNPSDDIDEKPQKEVKPETAQSTSGVDTRAKEILYIIGKSNLQELHTALQHLFGAKKGKTYYDAFKSDSSFNSFIDNHKKLSQSEKIKLYCQIAFQLVNSSLAMPNDFPQFVTETWNKKKNLNSFRASLQGKYGKEKSDKYYSLIKAHIKIFDKIK